MQSVSALNMRSHASLRRLLARPQSVAVPVRAARQASALAAHSEHGVAEHGDHTSRPPIVTGEPDGGFIVQASPRDWERDPQLAALNYPQMQGPLWSYSHFLRPWRRDRYWPAERVQYGETLHESEDVLSTLSSDPYQSFQWRHFIVFYGGVAVILGSVTAFASFLVKENGLPWTKRATGTTEQLRAELADTGIEDE